MAEHGDEPQRADAPLPLAPDDEVQATRVIEPIDPDGQPTEVIARGVPASGEVPQGDDPPAVVPAKRRRTSRAARIWIVIIAVLVVLVALVVVGDVVARGIAEERVAEEIQGNLPAGVEGDVDVSIGGFSVIAQYLSGTMEQVTLTAPELSVAGAPIDVTVVAQGVPVDLAAPVRELDAVINVDEASLNQFVEAAGIEGGLALGEGTVAYDGQLELLGFPVEYSVTARPIAAGTTVLLEPVGVEVGAGGGALDVSGIIERLLGDDPVEVCVADRLPEGMEVESIAVAPGTARIDLAAQGLTLDPASLQQTGTCP
jgi:hypothetical protein